LALGYIFVTSNTPLRTEGRRVSIRTPTLERAGSITSRSAQLRIPSY